MYYFLNTLLNLLGGSGADGGGGGGGGGGLGPPELRPVVDAGRNLFLASQEFRNT